MKYIKDALRKIIISVSLCMMGELGMVNMDNISSKEIPGNEKIKLYLGDMK